MRGSNPDGDSELVIFTLNPLGDFNNDGVLDVTDGDSLVGQIVAGENNTWFDVTNDDLVDDADLRHWLSIAGSENGFEDAYLMGDANLDGTVNASDLNKVGFHWLQEPATVVCRRLHGRRFRERRRPELRGAELATVRTVSECRIRRSRTDDAFVNCLRRGVPDTRSPPAMQVELHSAWVAARSARVSRPRRTTDRRSPEVASCLAMRGDLRANRVRVGRLGRPAHSRETAHAGVRPATATPCMSRESTMD